MLPDPVPDAMKVRPSAGARSAWNPVFRVDVLESPDPDRLILVHDGTVGSTIRRFDGRAEEVRFYDQDDRRLPFRLLPPGPEVAIIGSAGGNEIIASLHFGASRVTAVELNPVTVGLLRGELADYSGRLAENPKVELHNAEGRSFLESSTRDQDLVWLVAPDSYAAMNAATAGGFVLSESYLYTSEMIGAALRRLRPGGILCAQFGEADYDRKPNRTARFLAGARLAFAAAGIADFPAHVLVATAPYSQRFSNSTILLRKSPLTPADVERFTAAVAEVPGAVVRWAPGNVPDPDGPVARVISLPEADLPAWAEGQPFDLRPVTDDSPFFWHFVRFGDLLSGRQWPGTPFLEEGLGERVLLALLATVALLAALLLLAPFAIARGAWPASTGATLRAGTYFAAIGTGFMFLEISLIQRLTLFLGYPTRSLTVTLLALLLSGGVGSLLSQRLDVRPRSLVLLAAALAVVLVILQRLLPQLPAWLAWPLPTRIALAVALVAPLGLCLGAFLPLGLRSIAEAGVGGGADDGGGTFVAWAWAVNGFFSVVSSVLATMLSMTLGFDRVMSLGLALYAVAVLALVGVMPGRAGRATAPAGVRD